MTTVVAIIDVQRIFAEPVSAWAAPRFDETRAPIARLVEHAGAAAIFTRFVPPARPAGAWRAYYREFPFALTAPGDPQYDLVEPWTGQRSVDASTFGKWDALRSLTDGDLVVAGVATDCCVIATVLAAADAGVRVRVAADACAGADDAAHDRALAIMASFAPLVEVTTVDAVVRA